MEDRERVDVERKKDIYTKGREIKSGNHLVIL